MRNCSTPLQTTYFSKHLGVLVGLIFALITLTNSNLALLNVFSWVIVLFIRVTNVSIFPQIVSISLVMLFLMKPLFLFKNLPHLLLHFRPGHLPLIKLLQWYNPSLLLGLVQCQTVSLPLQHTGLPLSHQPKSIFILHQRPTIHQAQPTPSPILI